MAPTGKAQAAAKELLDSILDIVVRIFGRLLAAIFVNMI
jgi:exocyst complex component 4